MIYGSVCSGIEAASVAYHELGWRPSFFSEIEKFPRAVLKHHYPDVPCHGDFTTIGEKEYDAVDILVGGTPCQSFSVAGKRLGLDDPRGNLSLEFIRLALRRHARWFKFENVPGLLTSAEGDDFATFLSAATGTYITTPPDGWKNSGIAKGRADRFGIAWRILDAQYFGVPQRRRRVFVIGYFGDWRPAAAVLFEPESLRGDITPSRAARKGTAPTLSARTKGGGGLGTDFEVGGGLIPFDMQAMGEYGDGELASTLKERDYKDATDLVAHSLRADGHDASDDGTGRGTLLMATYPINSQIAMRCESLGEGTGMGIGDNGDPCFTLLAGHSHAVAAFKGGQGYKAGGIGYDENLSPTLSSADSGSNRTPALMQGMQVRRLTPRECERLQGFPDDYTRITAKTKDGPRYKAIGNSMAVPVMRWLGQRIDMVNKLFHVKQ